MHHHLSLADLASLAGGVVPASLFPHPHTMQPLTATAKVGQVCIACGFRKYESEHDQTEACLCELTEADDYTILICPSCCDDLVLVKPGEKVPAWHTCGAELERAQCTECLEWATGTQEWSEHNPDSHSFETFYEPRCGKHGGR